MGVRAISLVGSLANARVRARAHRFLLAPAI